MCSSYLSLRQFGAITIYTFEELSFLIKKCGLHLNDNVNLTNKAYEFFIDIKFVSFKGSKMLFCGCKIAIMTFKAACINVLCKIKMGIWNVFIDYGIIQQVT